MSLLKTLRKPMPIYINTKWGEKCSICYNLEYFSRTGIIYCPSNQSAYLDTVIIANCVPKFLDGFTVLFASKLHLFSTWIVYHTTYTNTVLSQRKGREQGNQNMRQFDGHTHKNLEGCAIRQYILPRVTVLIKIIRTKQYFKTKQNQFK